jgi:cytochrome P450
VRALTNVAGFVRDPKQFLLSAFERQGDVARFRIVTDDFVLFAHPDAVREVLRHQGGAFGKAPMAFLEVVVKRSMLITEGAEWQKARTAFRPHLTARAAAQDEATATAVDRLVDRLEAPARAGAPFDISAAFLELSIRAQLGRLLGTDAIDRHFAAVMRASELVPTFNERNLALPFVPPSVPLPWNRAMHRAMADIDAAFEHGIAGVRAGRTGPDIAAQSLANGTQLSDTELRDELIGLLFAAFESTYVTLSWAIHLLAREPLWQRAVAEDEAAARQVTTEVLRLYPAFPLIPRRAVTDATVAGTPVAKGTFVVTSPWVTHRHPKFWERAEVFDPARFADGRRSIRPGAYFPFGDGPRNCVGQHVAEAAVNRCLRAVLRAYEITPEPARPAPHPRGVPIRPAGGVWVRLRPRPA